MKPCVLVAGVGNVALGDDGFGVEVIRRLEGMVLPDWVRIADYGVGAGCGHVDKALSGGYDTTILVDATPRGGAPGELHVLEAELDDPPSALPALLDPHGIRPEGALRLLQVLDGDAGRVLVVGCEPERTGEGIGLSEAVGAAVDKAVQIITHLIWGSELPAGLQARLQAGLQGLHMEAPRELKTVPGK